jgi:hypothetical protein
MGYRLLLWLAAGTNAWSLLGLAVTACVLTFAGEAIGIVFHVSPMRVLQTAFDFDPAVIRPGWLVLAAGLIAHVVHLLRTRPASNETDPGSSHTAPARAS